MTLIIAIDGPAGSGKSTTAKILANKLGISYLDTGAMYRALTVYFLDNKINFEQVDIKILISSIDLEICRSGESDAIILNGADVTSRLRESKVTELVSKISANADIREWMVDMQRKLARLDSTVIDGRDIGTVVFPDADYKFFLVASIEVRAKRRFLSEEENRSLSSITKGIKRRDYLDSTREISPLIEAKDAITIDTTDLTINEQVNMIYKLIKTNNQEIENK